MINKKRHYIFHKYKNHGDEVNVFTSEHTCYETALFEFVYQTLGYAILEVETGEETSIQAKEV